MNKQTSQVIVPSRGCLAIGFCAEIGASTRLQVPYLRQFFGCRQVADGVATSSMLGLSKETLFHVLLPRAQCKTCGAKRLQATVEGSNLFPTDSVPTCAADVVLQRVVKMTCLDWFCRTFRKHWNQQALQASYADLIGTSMSHIQLTRGPAFHPAVFLYFKAGVPAARKLAQMVLLRFQQTEGPRLEQQARWVCARFGAVVAVDGSSAPLQEARTYVRKQDRATQAGMERPGAAIRALGLCDMPLCPTVFTRTQGRQARSGGAGGFRCCPGANGRC